MARKLKKIESPKDLINTAFTLERRQVQRLDEIRKTEGLNRSQFMRQVLDFAFDFTEVFEKGFGAETEFGKKIEKMVKNILEVQLKERKLE